jgi:SNF2 family DNA or RNA helicase
MRLPLRYILADDPGAGKNIMTVLFLKELLVRGDLKRCMIVSPGNLAEQWQDELFRKFSLRFEFEKALPRTPGFCRDRGKL